MAKTILIYPERRIRSAWLRAKRCMNEGTRLVKEVEGATVDVAVDTDIKGFVFGAYSYDEYKEIKRDNYKYEKEFYQAVFDEIKNRRF